MPHRPLYKTLHSFSARRWAHNSVARDQVRGKCGVLLALGTVAAAAIEKQIAGPWGVSALLNWQRGEAWCMH